MMLTEQVLSIEEEAMRRKLGTSAALVVALAVTLTATAAAAGPVVTERQVDRTFVIPASPGTCPFGVVGHSQGSVRESVFSDGRDVTILHDFTVTYANPLSGKSLVTPLGGPFVVEPNADGTVTVTINGNDGRFVAPGEGLIFGDVGRLVYVADPSDVFTPLQILQSTGHEDASPFPAVCSALS